MWRPAAGCDVGGRPPFGGRVMTVVVWLLVSRPGARPARTDGWCRIGCDVGDGCRHDGDDGGDVGEGTEAVDGLKCPTDRRSRQAPGGYGQQFVLSLEISLVYDWQYLSDWGPSSQCLVL